MDFWQVLPVAIALVFVVEGIPPFLSPARWRMVLAVVIQLDDATLRKYGLGCMLFGLGLLYLVN